MKSGSMRKRVDRNHPTEVTGDLKFITETLEALEKNRLDEVKTFLSDWQSELMQLKELHDSGEIDEEETEFDGFLQASREYLVYLLSDWKSNINNYEVVRGDFLQRWNKGVKAHFDKNQQDGKG